MKFYSIIAFLLLFNVVNAQGIDIKEINNLYYNMNDYNFKGFSAVIKCDIFDNFKSNVKDEKLLKVLNNLVFKVEFYGKDSVNFYVENLTKTNNEQVDLGLNQAVDGIEQMVKGFFISWSEFVFSPVLSSDKDYKFEIQDRLLIAKHKEDNLDEVLYLNNFVSMDSLIAIDESSITKVYPVYEQTSFNKKIVKSFSTLVSDFKIKVEIKYKDFDKLKIPYITNTSIWSENMTQNYQLEFTDIKLL